MNAIPRSPGWWVYAVLGLAVSVVFLAIIFAAHLFGDGRPPPLYVRWAYATDLLAVEDGHPCPGRVALACARRVDAGWSGCTVVPVGTPGAALVVVGAVPDAEDGTPRRGGVGLVGEQVVIHHGEDACETNDFTLEHETGHVVPVPCPEGYGVCVWDDDDFAGSVMNRSYEGRELLPTGDHEPIEGADSVRLGGMGHLFPRPPQEDR